MEFFFLTDFMAEVKLILNIELINGDHVLKFIFVNEYLLICPAEFNFAVVWFSVFFTRKPRLQLLVGTNFAD
jgi:hypothetical protein